MSSIVVIVNEQRYNPVVKLRRKWESQSGLALNNKVDQGRRGAGQGGFLVDEKHTRRTVSPEQGQVVYRAKVAYERFLAKYPHLKSEVRHLKLGKPPGGGVPDDIEGDRVYFCEQAVYVELVAESEAQVGPTGGAVKHWGHRGF